MMNRYWTLILVAGVFEIGWVIGLKHSYNAWTWIATFVAILISMVLLIKSTEKLPVGTAYAVFTGIGTAGTAVVEIVLFDVPASALRLSLILLLLVGVVGLKMITKEPEVAESKGGEA